MWLGVRGEPRPRFVPLLLCPGSFCALVARLATTADTSDMAAGATSPCRLEEQRRPGRAHAALQRHASSLLAVAGETPRKPQAKGARWAAAACGQGVPWESNAVFCGKHLEFDLSRDISFYQLYGPWCLAMRWGPHVTHSAPDPGGIGREGAIRHSAMTGLAEEGKSRSRADARLARGDTDGSELARFAPAVHRRCEAACLLAPARSTGAACAAARSTGAPTENTADYCPERPDCREPCRFPATLPWPAHRRDQHVNERTSAARAAALPQHGR